MSDHEVLALVDSYVPRKLRAVALGGQASGVATFTPEELYQLSADVEEAIIRAFTAARAQ